MSARFIAKALVVCASIVTILSATGCVEEVADVDDVRAGTACFGPSKGSQPRFFDDEYVAQYSDNGMCLTKQGEVEDLEQSLVDAELNRKAAEVRAAAEKKEHEARKIQHELVLKDKLVAVSSSNDKLETIVTYYCQQAGKTTNQAALADGKTASLRALVEVTESAYDLHWRADGTEVWPYDYRRAIERFGCIVAPDVVTVVPSPHESDM